MHGFAAASIMVGIAVAYFAQLVGAVLVFPSSISKATTQQSLPSGPRV